MHRRSKREYLTTEGSWKDPADYFEKIIWPEHLKMSQVYYQEWERRKGVVTKGKEKANNKKTTTDIDLEKKEEMVGMRLIRGTQLRFLETENLSLVSMVEFVLDDILTIFPH